MLMTLNKNSPYPKIFAHRCGGALAPENTLVGLDITRQLGCQGVEFDVMLSSNGTPWIIHDSSLLRTTGEEGEVSARSDSQLAQLDAGSRHHAAFKGEAIPRFDEVIARCRQLKLHMNIEIKPAPGYDEVTGTTTAQYLLDTHQKNDLPVLLSSFSYSALEAAKRIAPNLPRGLLIDRLQDDWLAQCRQLDVCAIHTNCNYLTHEQVTQAKQARLWIVVYTENDVDHGKQLLDWGVDIIITDRPDRFSSMLNLQNEGTSIN